MNQITTKKSTIGATTLQDSYPVMDDTPSTPQSVKLPSGYGVDGSTYTGGGNGVTGRISPVTLFYISGPSSEASTSQSVNNLLFPANSGSYYVASKWGGQIGQSVNLSVSFSTAASVYGYSNEDTLNKQVFGAGQITAARAAMSLWGNVANLTFTETTDSASNAGDIRWGKTTSSLTPTAKGTPSIFDFFAGALPAGSGDVWVGTNYPQYYDNPVAGQYGYQTMVHELGHVLGLAHPHQSSVAPVAGEDQLKYSVMSYRSYDGASTTTGYTNAYFPTTPMLNDILAIQFLYGVNTSYQTGNNTYSWASNKVVYETIWDAGGTDTIDAGSQAQGVLLNLNAGQWSQIGVAFYDNAVNGTLLVRDKLTIAYGAVIENATGSAYADTLIGNSVSNTLIGAASNDSLTGNGGNDSLDGGTGTDVAVCNTWATCTVTGDSTSATVLDSTGTNGTDTLSNIENLTFDGVTVTTSAAVNDAPVGVADDNASDAVIEAGTGVVGDSSAIGNVLTNDTDADSILGLGETQTVATVNGQTTNVGAAVAGTYGSLTLLAAGGYTYALDNNNPATDALSAGQLVSDLFTYTLVDAHNASSASTTLSISITGSSDAPINTAPTLTAFAASVATGNEDNQIPITFANLQTQGNEADSDGTVTAFVVKSISSGTLVSSGGVPLVVGDVIDTNNSAFWTPALNARGTQMNAITVVARDNGGLESALPAVQATVDVTSVNDAPAGTDNTVALNEDTIHTFTVADFGFTDPNDNPADSLANVIITSLPAAGSLQLNGVAVTAGQSIGALAIGTLTFTPTANANGLNYANFGFKVQDNGGTANGGIDTSTTANTMTLDVTPVNDSPVVALPLTTQSAIKNTVFNYAVPANSFTDIDAGDTLTYTASLADGSALPAWLSFNSASQTFSGTPSTGGTLALKVTATDSAAASVSSAFNLIVKTPNVTDFNNDGKSDLLWTNSSNLNGSLSFFIMNGLIPTVQNYISYNADGNLGQVINTKGDYNGDGNTDLLWWNSSTSSATITEMNGSTISAQGAVDYAQNKTGWTVADSSADFNADGKSDTLWWNSSTNTIALYLQNGFTSLSNADLTPNIDLTGWTIKSAGGDYNGDGNADILLTNAIGSIYMLNMNGATIASQGYVYEAGPNSWGPSTWTVVEAKGDFNGDGNSDILLRDTANGLLWQFQMNGTTITNGSGYGENTGALPLESVVIDASSDFNGDHKSDILTRNTSDSSSLIWLMDGPVLTNGAMLGPYSGVDGTWVAQNAHNDVNGDGKADVLWTRPDGAADVFLVDGALNPVTVTDTSMYGPYTGWSITAADPTVTAIAASVPTLTLTGIAAELLVM